MTPRLLLFDLDGTLVDSEHMIMAAQAQAFAAVDLPMPDRARALSIVGLSLHEAFTELVGADGPVEAMVQAYKSAFSTLRQAAALPEELFPGASAALDSLSRRDAMRLGVATGKSRRGVDALIGKHGWQGRFATIQTADDAPSKPDPAMILQAMHETGIAASRVTMIGDSSYDMQMARRAGVRAVGVSWGFQPREALLAAGAECIVESFDALLGLVEGQRS